MERRPRTIGIRKPEILLGRILVTDCGDINCAGVLSDPAIPNFPSAARFSKIGPNANTGCKSEDPATLQLKSPAPDCMNETSPELRSAVSKRSSVKVKVCRFPSTCGVCEMRRDFEIRPKRWSCVSSCLNCSTRIGRTINNGARTSLSQ